MIGKMDKIIVIIEPTSGTTDNMGGNIFLSSVLYGDRWANIVEKPVNPLYELNQIEHKNNLKITIRVDRGITEKFFITYNNQRYTINDIYHDEKYTYLKVYGTRNN